MATSGGIWVPMAQRVLRQVLTAGSKATKVLRNQVVAATRGELEPIAVRSSPSHTYTTRQPVHPHALRRQLKNGGSRWYSTAQSSVRRFFSASSRAANSNTSYIPRYADRVAFLKSSVGSNAVWKAPGRAPFASTLRPNLTGGALPRTAGGYSLGGGASGRAGARYFSHTPAAPAQVVQNVSQAMRAFWVSGKRARFEGTDANGRPCYKAISALEEETARKLKVPAMPKMAPGSFVDFPLNPTITALAPMVIPGAAPQNYKAAAAVAFANTTPATLGTEGFLDVLNIDFSRALKELSAIMNDLKRLAALGDLPVVLNDSPRGSGSSLRVRFPGVDALTVDRLCEDLGITRGIVGQDPEFDLALATLTALKFPYAPDASPAGMMDECVLTSPGGSLRSHQSSTFSEQVEDEFLSDEDDEVYEAYFEENPWLSIAPSSSAGFGSGANFDLNLSEDGYESMSPPVPVSSGAGNSQAFEGLEGVYRFIEECDRVQQRF
ncbi:casein kinase ii beta 2 subunit [Ophiostoma piceae UAMH 11346]|uniref:Casein kinase ii beta 2 subunit n=1 Tax=Ophiostoma piceae (strain UAMH 11346) TaxID=1262450 RepID=S3CAH2_OPHP1|nr:casein kinase ii beta 2 subunit [Ophiostoma piceae UAMH 11346]